MAALTSYACFKEEHCHWRGRKAVPKAAGGKGSRNMVFEDLGIYTRTSAPSGTFLQLALHECPLDTQLSSEMRAGEEYNTVPHTNILHVRGQSSGFESSRLHVPPCEWASRLCHPIKGMVKSSLRRSRKLKT